MSIPKSIFWKMTGCFSEYRKLTFVTSMTGRESSGTSVNSSLTVYSLGRLMSSTTSAASVPVAMAWFFFFWLRAPASRLLVFFIVSVALFLDWPCRLSSRPQLLFASVCYASRSCIVKSLDRPP